MHDIVRVLASVPQEPARQVSDREDPANLSDQLANLAIDRRDNYGEYDRYRMLIDAADALEVMGLEIAEARATVQRLLVEIKDLREQLATYRVVEVVAATREIPAEFDWQRQYNDEDYDNA